MVDTIDGIVSGRKVRIFIVTLTSLTFIMLVISVPFQSLYSENRTLILFLFLPFHCQSQFVLFFDVHFTLKKLFFD